MCSQCCWQTFPGQECHWILEHGFCWTSPHQVVTFLKPPWIILLLCMIPFLSFMPNNPALHPLFPSLKKLKGKMTVSKNSEYSEFNTSLLDLSVLKMNLAACHGFPWRSESSFMPLGRALCSSDFALKSGSVVGKWRFWDPSLQAPKLAGTVRFYKVLLQSPSNFHLPWCSSVSPSLVQVSLQKWSHRFPKISSCRSWVGWQLCCAFRISVSQVL